MGGLILRVDDAADVVGHRRCAERDSRTERHDPRDDGGHPHGVADPASPTWHERDRGHGRDLAGVVTDIKAAVNDYRLKHVPAEAAH